MNIKASIGGYVPINMEQKLYARNMTLRDYFAAKAIQGLLACPVQPQSDGLMFARDAYVMADAMLKARES